MTMYLYIFVLYSVFRIYAMINKLKIKHIHINKVSSYAKQRNEFGTTDENSINY
jgi:hypothetical protein